MYGLINRSVQAFLRDNYGLLLWQNVAQKAGVSPEGFETMLPYEDRVTEELLKAASEVLDKPREALLDDIGAYLVSGELVRRLLRFGGVDYWEFLYSLDELRDRGQMALHDLQLPDLTLVSETGGQFVFSVRGTMPGWGSVAAGLLRAMADDYGALALIEVLPDEDGAERVQVNLMDDAFNQGRGFMLAPAETVEARA